MRITVVLLLFGSLLACSGPEATRSTTTASTATPGGQQAATVTVAGNSPTQDASASGATPTVADSSSSATTEPEPQSTPSATTDATPRATDTAVVAPTTPPAATPAATPAGDPIDGLLPGHRIVSYYGHPNSTSMGILGEFDKDEVLRLLREQAAAFEAADPSTPVVLAFELIATVAQPWPMDDGTYVAYTGDEIIGEFVEFVEANDMILILDLQIGHDTIVNQINLIRHWLEHPRVHVALDPEFSTAANEIVPRDRIPGEFIGESNGHDIQAGMELLAEIVRENNLPAKILMVHQFEDEMIYNKDVITPVPGVNFVLDMDGFGSPEAKLTNYDHFVRDQLIEYGAIKMFYRQDDPLLTPEVIVSLDPPPLVVIYQ
jgi:hypothetical protein